MAHLTATDGEYRLDVELDRTVHPTDSVLFVRVHHNHQHWRVTLRLRRGQWQATASVAEGVGRLGAPPQQVVAYVDAYAFGNFADLTVQPLTRELVG